MFIRLFSFVLFIFAVTGLQASDTETIHSSVQPDAEEFLNRGLEAEERGDYEEALSIWLEAKSVVSTPSTAIGANYIRLVTEQGMERYYPAASAMYLWGLSGDDIAANRGYLEQELIYLEPLLSDDRYREWNRLLEEEDPALFENMFLWWDRLDPTPSTPANERLIEHWERIAYARENYTRHRQSIYQTDDRGLIYVKYGRPDRLYDGRLEISSNEVCSVIRDRLSTGGFISCTDEGVRDMENRVWEFSGSPYYEIWVYLSPNEAMKYNMIRMFAEQPDGGGFGQIRTVDDLIPNRAFSLTSHYSFDGITSGILMQWIYYSKLASIDPYFGDLFSRLDFRFMRDEPTTDQQFLGGQKKQEHMHITQQEISASPEEISTYTRDLSDIPLDIHQYRLLDGQNRPIYATVIESRPQRAFLEDLSVNQEAIEDTAASDEIFAAYELYHGMELRDGEGRRLTGNRMRTVLILDGNDMQVASGSIFTIPHVSTETRQVFYAELHNRHPDTAPMAETAFPDYLRGLGKVELAQPEPLDTDPSTLQMSDLILGYDKSDSTAADRFVPFVISNDRRVPEGETLAIHFEVYHLQVDAGGVHRFSIDYEILPVNFLGWTQERRDRLSLTLNFEHDEPRFVEDLEIEAADLDTGRYVLRMTATDRVSGQESYREVEFEVVEATVQSGE